MRARVLVWLVAGLLAAMANAEVLDQESPPMSANFNMNASSLDWQQEVVVGVAGALVRIELNVNPIGSATLYLHAGAPWQGPPHPWTTTFSPSGNDWQSVDVRAANLSFNVGDHFVIGLQGTDQGLGLNGSYVLPDGGYPAGRLFLLGNNFADGGWDIAFRTYMETGPRVCRGDTNCDGEIDFSDINPFVLALSDFAEWQTEFPDCPAANVDIDGDGQVNFNDINPFVALLTGGATCPP